jgi:hypothetical protein
MRPEGHVHVDNFVEMAAANGGTPLSVGKSTVVDVTLSLDTSIYASGDLLADTQVVAGVGRANDLGGIIQSLTVVDKDDQGASFDVWFLDANNTLGTENAAPSISDANAATIFGRVQVGSGDYYDLGGVRVAHLSNLAIPYKPVAGGTSIYVAVVNGTGTPTYSAAGVVLRIGLLQD